MMNYDACIKEDKMFIFGEAYTLLEISLIVLDEQLRIQYINDFCLNLLNIHDNVIGLPFIAVWKQLKLPSLINTKGKLIAKNTMLINNQFRKWIKKKILINDKCHYFLVDKNVTELKHIQDTISSECKKLRVIILMMKCRQLNTYMKFIII